jgi:large subunit ribosomal protein L15
LDQAKEKPAVVVVKVRLHVQVFPLMGLREDRCLFTVAYQSEGLQTSLPRNLQRSTLGRLQQAIDAGKIDPTKPIKGDSLVESGIVRRVLDGIRLLGKGELKSKISLEVTGATKSAIAAVEKAGGTVTVLISAQSSETSK